MADGEIEIPLLQQRLLDAEHHIGEVSLTELWNDNPNSVGEASAKHTRMQVRPIGELPGGCKDTLASCERDRLCDRGVIENNRDRSGGEIEILGEDLQRRRFGRVENSLLFRCHFSPYAEYVATVVRPPLSMQKMKMMRAEMSEPWQIRRNYKEVTILRLNDDNGSDRMH